MQDLGTLLIYTSIGSVAGLVGGVILLFRKKWAESLATVSVPLAAGVLLALSFLDLLPEAINEYGNDSFNLILVVFVILFLIERFFFYLHHHSEENETHSGHMHAKGETIIALVVIGDSIHNFLDGIVIGAAYLTNPSLALLVAFSTFIHETPHEVADFGILLSKGWSRKKVFITNFLSALTTFPGAILTYYFADKIEQGTGFLLAIAAGFFLYVATTDFLPEATHAPKKFIVRQAVFLLAGIFVMAIVRSLFPEIGH